MRFLHKLAESSFLQQRRFITFLFFLFLSLTFWLIRSLGEEYESRVNYPVRYMNFPENKVLVGDVPYTLELTVRARGFALLKSKLKLDLVPLRFNVSSISLNSKGVDTFFIVTETVKDILSTELKDMVILDVFPDTLFFKLTGVSVKKVRIVPVLDLHDHFFQQQYMLNGNIELMPDSIIISGPSNLVDAIDHILTKPTRYTNLSDTVVGELELSPLEMITFSQLKVTATIPVDRFTEVENRLTIIPVNVPDSLNMIAIPGQITVTYQICLSNYNRVINNPLNPRVDYNAIKDSPLPRLNVFLTDTPAYINNLRFNPKVIEYLITRK
jgi:hypothetical protein